MHLSYAVAFWYASRLVLWDPDFDRGAVFTVFVSLIFCFIFCKKFK
jgi:hypothetical protein